MEFISAHDNGRGSSRRRPATGSLKFSDPGLERKVVATGDQAENAFPTMERAAKRINSEKLNYRLIEQNCNSAAHYILTSAGFGDTRGPSLMTRKFGWSTALEEQLNRPQRTRATAVITGSLVHGARGARRAGAAASDGRHTAVHRPGPVTTAAPAPIGSAPRRRPPWPRTRRPPTPAPPSVGRRP